MSEDIALARVGGRRTTEELRALVAEAQVWLAGGPARPTGDATERTAAPTEPTAAPTEPTAAPTEPTAEQLIGWVAEHFAQQSVAVACSMADAVLPHLVASQIPNVDVLFLDTGYHFVETIATRNVVEQELPVRIVDVRPEQTVAEQDATEGPRLYERDPNRCCQLRKVQPLQMSLKKYEVWFTGVRREEATTRTETPLITFDEKNGLVKVNPLAAWSFADLTDYAAANRVPVNLLLTNGYPSIGCAPCTAPVAPGEDPRSGRWAGKGKVECGLHA